MKNKIAMLCSAVLALAPYAAMADIDPTSLIQDKLRNGFEEANKVFKEYTGQELDLQQLVNNRDKLGELKKLGKNFAIDAAMAYGSNIKIRSLSVKGIAGDIKGSFGTPELARKLGKKMTQKSKVNDDVVKAQEKQKMINELQVENVATMYAKALVLRRSIINEGKQLEEEEKTEITDLTQIEDAYKAVSTRANGRWKTILDAAANYQGQSATSALLNIRADAAKEAEEEAAATAKKAAESQAAEGKSGENGETGENGGFSISDAYNKGKDSLNKVKNGDYGGALGTLGEAAGGVGIDSGIADGIKTAGDTYNKGTSTINSVKNGNYGDALGTLGEAAGGVGIGSGIADGIKTAGDTYNKGTSTINSVKNGDYGGALGTLGEAASGVGIGSDVVDGLKNAGNTYNQGSNLVNSVKNGDVNGILDGVVSTADSVNKLGGYDQEAIDAQKKAQEEANAKANQSAADAMKGYSEEHRNDVSNNLLNSSWNQQGQNLLNGSSNSNETKSTSGRNNTSWNFGSGTKK